MWKQNITIVLLIIIAALIINSKAVSFSSLCKLEDSACLKKTAQDFVPTFAAGIPDIGLKSCDPMNIKRVDASTQNLNLVLTNLAVTGLKNSRINSLSFGKSKTSVSLNIQCTVKLDGNYKMKGNLVFVPIEGEGLAHAKISNMEIVANADLTNKVGKDGKSYWHLQYKDHSYALKGKSDLEFENLFGGNVVLAAASKEVVAQAGNEIIAEIGGPVITTVIHELIKDINVLFGSIPADDIHLV